MNAVSKIEQVLERLGDYEERGDDLRARCPAHGGESSDSLSVREGEGGQMLLHCFHGCEFEDIMEALDLDPGDLAPSGKANGRPIGSPSDKDGEVIPVDELPGTIDEYYAFQEDDGTYLYVQRHKGAYYRVVGFDEDGDPLFKRGLTGVDPVLYGLPELKEAIDNGSIVVHTEGCKDARAATKRLGMAGVTSGGTTSWKSEFAHNYEGAKEVWIVPDNDGGGYSYALQVAQDLVSVVETVKILVLPDLPDKGDLTDWLDAGHTSDEFFQIAEDTE
jgi:putative DNA primase/helicase